MCNLTELLAGEREIVREEKWIPPEEMNLRI
jgi:hypothetical protein